MREDRGGGFRQEVIGAASKEGLCLAIGCSVRD